jgi:uncharacterized membrane protein
MTPLLIALAAFVGTHLLLSHPLRPAVVGAVGEKGFAGVYSLVAFVTLGWAIWEWRSAPSVILWTAPEWAWWAAVPVMILASVLLVGSVSAPNPALVGAGGTASATPRGVLRITRHPMMWSFALWAVVHGWLSGDARTVALCVAIGGLALVGAWFQDGKKRGQLGTKWAAHEGATSFVPFGRGAANPGAVALIGGAVLFIAATWAHPLLGGPALWGMVG